MVTPRAISQSTELPSERDRAAEGLGRAGSCENSNRGPVGRGSGLHSAQRFWGPWLMDAAGNQLALPWLSESAEEMMRQGNRDEAPVSCLCFATLLAHPRALSSAWSIGVGGN